MPCRHPKSHPQLSRRQTVPRSGQNRQNQHHPAAGWALIAWACSRCSAASPSSSSSNGASLSSLPRWRQLLLDACNSASHLGATLNWRRDPGYEQLMLHYERRKMHYERRKMQHELRM
jgi:hypothetical protein